MAEPLLVHTGIPRRASTARTVALGETLHVAAGAEGASGTRQYHAANVVGSLDLGQR